MINSVRLYYIKQPREADASQIDDQLLEQWLTELSAARQAALRRLINNRDRLKSLLAMQLLKRGVLHEGIEDFNLADIHYPASGKPFWKRKSSNFFDFNITHSGNLIMMALSTTVKVGIDAEKIRPLQRLNFKMVLSPQELDSIQQTPALFFDLWSKKEAVVKAADTTGLARMREVELSGEQAMLDSVTWYLQSIGLNSPPPDVSSDDDKESYAIHLASSAPLQTIILKQLFIDELLPMTSNGLRP